jgi:hypothetical protein
MNIVEFKGRSNILFLPEEILDMYHGTGIIFLSSGAKWKAWPINKQVTDRTFLLFGVPPLL